MGLDMFACILEKASPSQVDFKDEDAAQLHYWRKHPNLHRLSAATELPARPQNLRMCWARGYAHIEVKQPGVPAALNSVRRERYSVAHARYADGLDHVLVGFSAPHPGRPASSTGCGGRRART